MKVSEFCGELTEVYVEIFDANDEKVYSDLLDDQDITEVEDEEIGSVIMGKGVLEIYLESYTAPLTPKIKIGSLWHTNLSPVVGNEIGGMIPCQVIEVFDGYDLIKVRPLRFLIGGGFAERIANYETVISTERLMSEIDQSKI
jgi:hypothetical protein